MPTNAAVTLVPGSPGPVARIAELVTLDGSELGEVFARADKASSLNPFVPPHAYFVLALAVLPAMRGTGVGARLLRNATETIAPAPCRQHGVPMEMRMVVPLTGGEA